MIGRRLQQGLYWMAIVMPLTACAGGPVKDGHTRTTVLVVRHAEKATEGSDPELTEAGQQRARALADRFCATGITSVHATQYRRTQATAAPCAESAATNVQVTTLSQDLEGDYKALRARILESPGGKVLVVGHSNTVPVMVKVLTGVVVAPIGDDEYGRWFEIEIDADGIGRLRESSY